MTKQYIFRCSYFDKALNIFDLQKKIKSKFTDEEYISKINKKNEKFNQIWNTWIPIFENI